MAGNGDDDRDDAEPVANSTDATGRDEKHGVPRRRVRAGELREEFLYELQVTSGTFHDRDLLLGYYQTQADEFRLRHAAIWEEIRHYTWLLSLLLSWPVALLSAKDLNQLWQYAPYFVFLPALGLCFSIIAFFVIRSEYEFYNESDAKLLYVEKELWSHLARRLPGSASQDGCSRWVHRG